MPLKLLQTFEPPETRRRISTIITRTAEHTDTRTESRPEPQLKEWGFSVAAVSLPKHKVAADCPFPNWYKKSGGREKKSIEEKLISQNRSQAQLGPTILMSVNQSKLRPLFDQRRLGSLAVQHYWVCLVVVTALLGFKDGGFDFGEPDAHWVMLLTRHAVWWRHILPPAQIAKKVAGTLT